MHVRIWPLMLSLAVLAGCAAPPPNEEASSVAEESTAATAQPTEIEQGGTLADENFESGRSETLEKVETPADAEQAE